MSAFTHENNVTKFYRYGELVFVVCDHSLNEARDLFHSILPRCIGAIRKCGETTLVKVGDTCDISLNEEAYLAGMPLPLYLEFLAQDAMAQELETLQLFD